MNLVWASRTSIQLEKVSVPRIKGWNTQEHTRQQTIWLFNNLNRVIRTAFCLPSTSGSYSKSRSLDSMIQCSSTMSPSSTNKGRLKAVWVWCFEDLCGNFGWFLTVLFAMGCIRHPYCLCFTQYFVTKVFSQALLQNWKCVNPLVCSLRIMT